MKKFTSAFIPFLVILSMLLAACEGSRPQAIRAPAVQAQPATNAKADVARICSESARNVSIEMWSPLTGPDGDEMSTLADRFSSENEYGIKVKHVAQDDYLGSLQTAVLAGSLPAMTVVRAINVGALAERNVLKPMTSDLMRALGPDIGSDFPNQLWNVGIYKGERYSFPLDTYTLVMFYNKDMFKAAGVEFPGKEPWARQQFEDAITRLDASGVQPIALGTGLQAATIFQALIVQFGGSLANDDGTKATYNSDAAIKAIEYIKNLRDKYSPEIAGPNESEVDVYKQGKAAILIQGSWHISEIQKLPFAGYAPFPQIGDKPADWAGSHQLGLTSDNPAQQAAAMCWIDWLSRNSIEWARAGQIPARTSVREDPQMSQVAPPIAAVIANAEHAVMLPQVAGLESALWDQFGQVVDSYLMGETTDLKTALDEAAARSQKTMDENDSRYGG